jgi:GTP-dependent phosphoenolpyruvate carboxykinase
MIGKEAVMLLELNEEQKETLLEVLEHAHKDLQKEIFKTDHREFRKRLQRKEEILQEVLNKIPHEVAA